MRKKVGQAGVAVSKLLSEPPFHYVQYGDGSSILHISWRFNDFVHIQWMLYYLRSDLRLYVLFRTPGPILGLKSNNRAPFPHHILEEVSVNKSLPKVLKVGCCLLGHPNCLPSRPRVYIPVCKGLGHGLTEPKIVLCLTLRLTPRPRARLVDVRGQMVRFILQW